MNHRVCCLLLALACVALGRAPANAQCTSGTLVVEVAPSAIEQSVSKAAIFGPDATAIPTSQPIHGALVDQGNTFAYRPAAGFWSLGSDTFTVRASSLIPGVIRNDPEVTVFLVAQIVREYGNYEGFESPSQVIPQIYASDPAMFAVLPDARLSGSYGLRTFGGVGGEVWLGIEPDPSHNGGDYGSCGQTIWRPPPSGPGGSLCSPTDPECDVAGDAVLMTAGDPTALLYGEVLARQAGGGVFLKLRAPNTSGQLATAWTPVSRTPHRLELAQVGPRSNRGAEVALFMDDAVLLTLDLPVYSASQLWPVPTFRFGQIKPSGNPGNYDLDQIGVWALNDVQSGICSQVESFETGSLTAGWSVFQPGNLAITTNASLLGKYSAAITIGTLGNPTGSSLIRSVSAVAGHKALRFRVNAASFQPTPPTGTVTIADGFNASSLRAFRLQLATNASGAALLRATARLDDGSQPQLTHNLGSFSTTRLIEVEWLTSPSTQGGTGYLRVWVDGTPVLLFSSVSNALQTLEEIRVGATSNPGNATGSILIDQIEMWGL